MERDVNDGIIRATLAGDRSSRSTIIQRAVHVVSLSFRKEGECPWGTG